MDRREDLLHLCVGHIVRIDVRLVLQRFHQRERCVEHNSRLAWRIGILQRIGDGNRTGVLAESATNADDYEIDGHQHQCQLTQVIGNRC